MLIEHAPGSGLSSARVGAAGTSPPATPISLIVVCRNARTGLMQTIESIRELRDSRVLPIIIDGASTDGTNLLLQTLKDWTFYACSEPDEGIYDAMNKGWAAAPANSYILYLGAGDLLLELPPDVALREPGGEAYSLVLGNTRVGPVEFRSRWTRELHLRNTAHHQAMLVLKRMSALPPFDASLRAYADWDFNLRLFGRGIRAAHVAGFRTYAAPGGASWSMDTSEIFRVSRRHGGLLVGSASWVLNSISRWRRFR